MIKNVLQCCYTNASEDIGGKVTSGWKAVAYSAEIPAEAFTECKAIQNMNSAIQGPMFDEQGGVLNLLEVCGDGSFFYVVRTQYGLLDRLGRANMFSHAYIFPCSQAVADPNIILTIEKSNFSDNEEAASAQREMLVRAPAYSLDTAMAKAGLTCETYIKLVRSVYVRMTEQKKGEPLYIQYDGTEAQLCAVLYCIYRGLPFYLRKSLKSASAPVNFPESRNIIFSIKATQHSYYIVPQTGENTVLSLRAEKRIERYGFIDYAVRNYGRVDGEDFYRELERLAIEMGDSTASNETLLRLAYQVMEKPNPEEYRDEDLEAWLADALRVRARGSALERRTALMLNELRRRGRFLDDEAEVTLTDRLGSTTNPELAEAGEQYNISRFATLPVEEAARRLGTMTAENFTRYSKTLAKSAQGLAILDRYFAERLTSGQPAWDKLSEVLTLSAHMQDRPLTKKIAAEQCWTLYSEALGSRAEIKSDYELYVQLMENLSPSHGDFKWAREAKRAYWDTVTFENFDCGNEEEYQFMRTDAGRCRMFLDAATIAGYLGNGEDEIFLDNVQRFFSMHDREVEGEQFEPAIAAFSRMVKGSYHGADKNFARWVRVAARANTPKALRSALKVREAIAGQDIDSIMDAYQALLETSGRGEMVRLFLREINVILIDWCANQDTPMRPIPLDMWLFISRSQYGNAFQIFDHVEPQILRMEPDSMNSELLTRSDIQKDAELYIQAKGDEARTVKKWMAGVKRAKQKEQAKANMDKHDGGKGPLSFFQGFRKK